MRRYWWQTILLSICLFVVVFANLQLPNRMASIVNEGIVGADQYIIWQQGAYMIGITIIGGLALVAAGFLASRIGTGFARDVRSDIFRQVMSYSIADIENFSTSSLITRTTNDVTQVQAALIIVLRLSLQAPIMGAGAIIMALQTAPNMTWIIATAVVILVAIVAIITPIVMPKFKLRQEMTDDLNRVTRENLTGLRVVRAFNNEEHAERKFHDINKPLTILHRDIDRILIITMPIVTLVVNLALLGVVWFGAHYIYDGVTQVGDVMAFMQYALQVMQAFMFLVMAFIIVPRALVSWKRVVEVLNTHTSIQSPKQPKEPAAGKHANIEFRDVTFSYLDAEEPVLRNISFTAKSGQTTAFIGSTGSGKSTLINLIPRFYDVTSGSVLVNGLDVREYDEADLRRRIGIVPQKSTLFTGTVAENIALGLQDTSDMKCIRRAARIAQAEDFVQKLDGKYDYEIAQGGNNVSGGQKQRLSIARAVARDPEIYIFDDSFSALDFKTDARLRSELTPVVKDACVLIVAQRVGTIKNADQIIVLDKGRIVGHGTHYQLLQSCKIYREITESQFSESEFKAELRKSKQKAGK